MSFPESTPEVTRWCALFVAIVLSVPTVLSILSLINAERTGVAFYAPNPRLPTTERVTRTASPKKFDEAILLSGYHVLYFGGIAFISFYFYRRLSD